MLSVDFSFILLFLVTLTGGNVYLKTFFSSSIPQKYDRMVTGGLPLLISWSIALLGICLGESTHILPVVCVIVTGLYVLVDTLFDHFEVK